MQIFLRPKFLQFLFGTAWVTKSKLLDQFFGRLPWINGRDFLFGGRCLEKGGAASASSFEVLSQCFRHPNLQIELLLEVVFVGMFEVTLESLILFSEPDLIAVEAEYLLLEPGQL
jgi:hypothetical protein